MPRVNDMRNSKKVNTKDERLSMAHEHPHDMTHDEVVRDISSWGIGGVHGKDYPPKTELNSEIVNDFTNETDFVKFSEERYIRFLESQVAQLQYKLHLLESGE